MPGTNQARISVRRWPNFNFDNQMLRLVRYPYGCLEQTVSSVFPQLYLKDLLDLEPEERRIVAADIDERINAGHPPAADAFNCPTTPSACGRANAKLPHGAASTPGTS